MPYYSFKKRDRGRGGGGKREREREREREKAVYRTKIILSLYNILTTGQNMFLAFHNNQYQLYRFLCFSYG